MKLLDQVDRRIVIELQKNGRISLTQIGKMMKISSVAINKRLERLSKRNIVKVSACLNGELLKFRTAVVLTEVENDRMLREMIKSCKNCPRLIFSTVLQASFLIAIFIGENMSTLESILSTCNIRTKPSVRRSEVLIGEAPVYPKFLPLRLSIKNNDVSPCGMKCNECVKYLNNKCLACPSTEFYKGPL